MYDFIARTFVMDDTQDIFTRLGGTRAVATLLSEAPSTVQSWKSARRIPADKQRKFLEIAEEKNLPVTAEDMIWPFGRAEQSEAAA